MLLTSLLSSACSLAVPSVAQKHYSGSEGGGGGFSDQNHSTLSASSPSTVGTTPSTLTLLHVVQQQQQQQQPERKQHGNHRRPAEPTAALGADGEHEYGHRPDHPDLYNLTLTAMRQYLRNHLNASRYGKAPRKRSHLHVDAVDVEFYRRFKEFNTSQAVLDGVAGLGSYPFGPTPNGSVGIGTDTVDRNGPAEPLPSVVNVTPVPVASSSVAPPATTGQRDYSVLMDDPRGYITVSSSFPLRPGKTSTTWNSTFAQHRGYIYGLVSFSVLCALVLGLFGVFRCLRATTTGTRATAEALTLPIQFLTDDLAPLDANLNHLPVPMLSVQSPGCAGMERLGVPARGSIGSPPLRNERAGFHHQQQSQQQQQQQQQQSQQTPQQQQQQQQSAQQQQQSQQNHHRHHHHHNHHHHPHQYHQQTAVATGHSNLRFSSSDLILSSTTSSNFRSNNHNQSYLFIPHQSNNVGGGGGGGSSSGSSSINYKTHYSNSSYGGSSIGSSASSNPVTSGFPHCIYHVPLPDGEFGPDRDLRIRTPCQQSEIPRTYVKAPPNKTVRDVPVQYQSTGGITTHGTTTTATMTGTGGSSSLASSMVDVASYYGSAKTIAGRPAGDGGRLAAATPGPSLGGGTTNSSSSATCQQKSVDKLQKIFRFLPGKATKSSTSSSSSSSSSSTSSSSSSASSTSSSCGGGMKHTSNINNNHQGAGTGVLPGSSHTSSTASLNNNNNVGGGGALGSISGSYGPSSSSVISSNHANNNRVGCGVGGSSSGSSGSTAGSNIRVDGRGGLSLAAPGAGIHNHNQHYRSPPTPAVVAATSPTSSSVSSSSTASSPTSLGSARPSEATGPGAEPGHAPFTM